MMPGVTESVTETESQRRLVQAGAAARAFLQQMDEEQQRQRGFHPVPGMPNFGTFQRPPHATAVGVISPLSPLIPPGQYPSS